MAKFIVKVFTTSHVTPWSETKWASKNINSAHSPRVYKKSYFSSFPKQKRLFHFKTEGSLCKLWISKMKLTEQKINYVSSLCLFISHHRPSSNHRVPRFLGLTRTPSTPVTLDRAHSSKPLQHPSNHLPVKQLNCG